MTAEIIPLRAPEYEPTTIMWHAGPARCLVCAYEFVATAEAGEVILECPNCETHHATFIYPISRDEPHWACECGNDLFRVAQSALYCPMCGRHHRPWDED